MLSQVMVISCSKVTGLVFAVTNKVKTTGMVATAGSHQRNGSGSSDSFTSSSGSSDSFSSGSSNTG